MTLEDCYQAYDCDRCGWTYDKRELRRQRGMLLCDKCFDSDVGGSDVSVDIIDLLDASGCYNVGYYDAGFYNM